jgi:hypothetical protein
MHDFQEAGRPSNTRRRVPGKALSSTCLPIMECGCVKAVLEMEEFEWRKALCGWWLRVVR